MGQAQSDSAVADESSNETSKVKENSNSNLQAPSMESLIAEAAAYGDDDENESLDAKAEKALNCPCIAELRSGPCGTEFSDAFRCFIKSTAEEKGSDCVNPFVMLQRCIKVHPNAFSKDVLEGEEEDKELSTKNDASEGEKVNKTEEQPSKDYKIIPPRWSLESQSPKPRL